MAFKMNGYEIDMDIGVINGKPKDGLFASIFTWILEVLPYLKKNNIRPKWNIDSYCYGMVFPSILKERNVNVLSNTAIKLKTLKNYYSYKFNASEWQYAHELFFDYFDIADDILQEVSTYQAKFYKKTLGVHFRGTDKNGNEATRISKENVISNIKAFLLKNTEFITIFVASDETAFINLMKESFDQTHKLIFINALRSDNNNPIHLSSSGIEQARTAMIDSLTLSKCDFVIKTSSCLSDWVKIWNPTIEVYNLNKFKKDWFPQATIPVKSFIN